MGTPRRRIPTSPRFSTPPFFSRISCARRTSVRSHAEPEHNCGFCRSAVLRTAFFLIVMPPVPYQTQIEFGKFVHDGTYCRSTSYERCRRGSISEIEVKQSILYFRYFRVFRDVPPLFPLS